MLARGGYAEALRPDQSFREGPYDAGLSSARRCAILACNELLEGWAPSSRRRRDRVKAER
jgi:hypothetical protein